MVAPVILYGSPVLRKSSADITGEDNITGISETLFSTLKNAKGIGLAGPQVSLLKRAFVIDTSPLSEDDITIEKYEKVFINPMILERNNDDVMFREGCLSIPDIFEEVKRPSKIWVRYNDLSFNIVEEEMTGIVARIFQHEYDHLEGILFIDKINPVKRKILSPKLNKIKILSRGSVNYYG
ncbi:MAG: peptide deformylase [Bacteroidales bacterium]|jgi:peptide deformylase|nr:peptide deformylase [Bacteroidales bacterium]